MEKIGMKVPEMGESLGISRATAYELATRPDFYPSFRIGKRILINRQLLEKWIAEQCKTDSGNVD